MQTRRATSEVAAASYSSSSSVSKYISATSAIAASSYSTWARFGSGETQAESTGSENAIISATKDVASSGLSLRTTQRLARIRATGSQEVAAEVLDECDFALALAHLRVPEMA
jgi:hypothetical protein